jgi:cytochrome c biogenesis protein
VWRLCSRLEVAALLLAIVLLLAAFASSLPQLSPTVAEDAARLANWREAVRSKYGPLADLYWFLGFFRFSRSALFLVPLGLLILSTILCTVNRWRGVWRRTFARTVVCPDAVFEASSYRERLEAQVGTNLQEVVQESLKERGFHVRHETSGGVVYLRGDRNSLSPLATLVNHLALLLLLAGALLSSAYAWREELTIPPGETAQISRRSGLALRNEGFVIARYPSGAAASYEAEIILIERGNQAASGTVRLNEPLAYGSARIYLRGYEGEEGDYTILLLAGYDPGYPLFVVAGCMLLVGLCVSFFLPHACLYSGAHPARGHALSGRTCGATGLQLWPRVRRPAGRAQAKDGEPHRRYGLRCSHVD